MIKKAARIIKILKLLVQFLLALEQKNQRYTSFSASSLSEIPNTCILTGSPENLFIGKHTVVGEHNILRFRVGKITIGDNVLLANNITLAAGTHEYWHADRPIVQQRMIFGEIVVGDGVWIGANTVVLTSARNKRTITIGNGAIIAAGSVVNKDIPPNEIWGGVPAQLIRNRLD